MNVDNVSGEAAQRPRKGEKRWMSKRGLLLCGSNPLYQTVVGCVIGWLTDYGNESAKYHRLSAVNS
jgi:hypothetical protein